MEDAQHAAGSPGAVGSAWLRVAEVGLSGAATVWVYVRCSAKPMGNKAWSAFTIIHANTVEVYVFAEDADNTSSNAIASAACLDA